MQKIIYHIPCDPYFACIFAAIIEELVREYPKSKHIVIPNFGIRFFEAPLSRYPTRLKKIQLSIRFALGQIKEVGRTQQLLKQYIEINTLKKLAFANPLKWLLHYYCNFITFSETKEKNPKTEIAKEYISYFSVNGIKVGDLCANTYMRYKPSATFNPSDRFLGLVEHGAKSLTSYWKSLTANPRSAYYIGTYGIYNHGGIPMRVAAQKGLGIINFGAMEIYFRHYPLHSIKNNELPTHLTDYPNYSTDCNRVITKELLEKAIKTLEQRTQNNHQETMPYMKSTIKNSNHGDAPQSLRSCVVVMLHDFFDSPHLYRHMLFPDFVTWVEQTIEHCLEKNISIFIKPHPNEIEESEAVTHALQVKYKNQPVQWINKSTPNALIFAAKPDLVITAYGSVIAEAAYMGIPVLLCGDHPAINFKIGHTAKSIEEYFDYISNHRHAKPSDTQEVALFTATHYQNIFLKSQDSLATHEKILISDRSISNQLRRPGTKSYTQLMARQIVREIKANSDC